MIRDRIRRAAAKRLLFLPQALRQMARPERMITPVKVRAVVEAGQVIEQYPDDPRGLSGLVLGEGHRGRPIHVVCAPRDDFLAVITAYVPSEDEWEPGFKVRKRQ